MTRLSDSLKLLVAVAALLENHLHNLFGHYFVLCFEVTHHLFHLVTGQEALGMSIAELFEFVEVHVGCWVEVNVLDALQDLLVRDTG